MVEMLLDIIFPKKCEICDKLGNYICDDCYKKSEKYEIISNSKNEYFLYKYEENIRSLLIDYKFNDKAYLKNLFSYCILKHESAVEFIKQYDVIIPVPIHKRRKRERGYNQSELVIKEVVKEIINENNNRNNNYKINSLYNKNLKEELTSPKIENNILRKMKHTKPQSANRYEDRIKSVKGIYSVENEYKIIEKKVLVFDDIYTTGSTFNECKKVLLNAGASDVGIMTIARDFMK